MKLLRISILTFILLLSGNIFSQTTYHVDINNGSDSNNGSLANPFKTLQKAADKIKNPGDLVLVHTGIYRNSDFDNSKKTPNDSYANNSNIWGGNTVLYINNKKGSKQQYIIFKPYNDDKVTLEFDNDYGVLIKNSSYIKFIGFTVKGIADRINQSEANAAWGKYKRNGTTHDLATELKIDLKNPPSVGSKIPKTKLTNPKSEKPSYYNGRAIVVNSSDNVEVLNNLIKDVPSAAIRVQKSDWVTVQGNEVKNCTYWTTAGVGAITVAEAISIDKSNDFKIKLINNYVHHNENRMVSWNPTKTEIHWAIDEGTGLFLTRNVASNGTGATGGGTDYNYGKMLIANNISAFNGASGIVCHYTNRVTIEHNTCYKNGTTNENSKGVAPGGIGVNSSNDVQIRNNIIYATSDSWAIGKLGGTISGIVRKKNIVYNEGGVTIHNNMSDGWINKDPKLIDPMNGNFMIDSNSPAVDYGFTGIEVKDDYLKNLRSDGKPDVGAYEYIDNSNLSNDANELGLKFYSFGGNIYLNAPKELQNITVKIFSLSGQSVYSKSFVGLKNKIIAPHLKNGNYILNIRTSCSNFTTKIKL